MWLGLLLASLVAVLACGTGTGPPGPDTVRPPSGSSFGTAPGSGAAPIPTRSPPPGPSSPSMFAPAPQDRAALADAVVSAVTDRVPHTRVGLAVHDRHAGVPLAEHNADERFYTASVVKLMIATHVLWRAEWRPPAGAERERLADMLARSTDWIASSLWATHGGPEITRRTAELAGLTATTGPADADEWELTLTSPNDLLALYSYLTGEMPGSAAEFVLATLSATSPAADGFDQGFGIPAALPGRDLAVKQGWMRTDDGLVLNTTGVVGPNDRYLVVLLTQQPSGTGFDEARQAVTAGIAALAPALAAPSAHPWPAPEDCALTRSC